jgi:hypothetical protein
METQTIDTLLIDNLRANIANENSEIAETGPWYVLETGEPILASTVKAVYCKLIPHSPTSEFQYNMSFRLQTHVGPRVFGHISPLFSVQDDAVVWWHAGIRDVPIANLPVEYITRLRSEDSVGLVKDRLLISEANIKRASSIIIAEALRKHKSIIWDSMLNIMIRACVVQALGYNYDITNPLGPSGQSPQIVTYPPVNYTPMASWILHEVDRMEPGPVLQHDSSREYHAPTQAEQRIFRHSDRHNPPREYPHESSHNPIQQDYPVSIRWDTPSYTVTGRRITSSDPVARDLDDNEIQDILIEANDRGVEATGRRVPDENSTGRVLSNINSDEYHEISDRLMARQDVSRVRAATQEMEPRLSQEEHRNEGNNGGDNEDEEDYDEGYYDEEYDDEDGPF